VRPLWYAALLLGGHRLLKYIEADPDGVILGSLPLCAQSWVRHHIKPILNPLSDLGATYLLPLLQPPKLKTFQPIVVVYDSQVNSAELTVFCPDSTSAPVLCFVHGGIWCLGNRQQYAALGQRLASEGFVAVIVGYSTWPTASASAQVAQVRRAVTHVKANAKQWGGDPARVYLSGQSSGANITASALLGSGPEVPRCAGYIGMAGVYDVESHYLYEKQRGVHNISPLGAACKPLSEHSPTRIAAESKLKLACDRVLILH